MKENGERAGGKGYEPDLEKGELAQPGGDGYGDEKQGAADISPDQDWLAPDAIYPDAGKETEEKVGERAGGGKQAHLRRRSAQYEDGGERQSDIRDGCTGAGGDVCDPEPGK